MQLAYVHGFVPSEREYVCMARRDYVYTERSNGGKS